MADAAFSLAPKPEGATGVLVLSDGHVIWGRGFGAVGNAVGEVCFNTSMTGYQEVMTDPSYAGQIVTFTFPHIGNVGVNDEDLESRVDSAVGCVVREDVTPSSNFRAEGEFGDWLAAKGKIGLAGVDTRALTRRIRLSGAPNAVIAHDPKGEFDIPALIKKAQEWPGLEGMDLAKIVSREHQEGWEGSTWTLGQGYGRSPRDERPHVVAMDFGAKDNIFRNLVKAGARVTVVPAEATLEQVLELKPEGVFLSNGPGDPAATGKYAVPVIQGLLERDVPIFGICLGHQMLALAAGASTSKMHQGHRGANHPVKRLADDVVEITSMNHGFAVDNATLPDTIEETHVSLFDGSNCGIAIKGKKAFGVQYHPEASPGPQDSFYLFEKFVGSLA
ncbi:MULTISPECIES: glutamine-hydrolyzing carbamoyl-phosphate synthase small subunit [unclassified Novosphingobium]|jgi:carbamoyl-phosphate synthase small subunit|uniref:glutamine-hydrolyzing carbamoyl-phosphate synthase small subunit n=1 Tax=unclassified Novosphingobium TaxID=2644732 RepID=UPI00020EEE8D|nr:MULTISPECIES: glutamine-hydrolyzing carbamoyl-phosphate synthase small subunit [unclassified Novosphingobium]GFM29603.1 carbamoyl-phosphate synthase small subunit [Novosphingobium sp. PY1]CCA93284.1 carbamoyl-phosphate synthase small subunit [Novosphingobium sp. PP1Y]